jgi:hypothetical protein
LVGGGHTLELSALSRGVGILKVVYREQKGVAKRCRWYSLTRNTIRADQKLPTDWIELDIQVLLKEVEQARKDVFSCVEMSKEQI